MNRLEIIFDYFTLSIIKYMYIYMMKKKKLVMSK